MKTKEALSVLVKEKFKDLTKEQLKLIKESIKRISKNKK